MMRSMTAFGRAKETAGGKDITVELRSVNSRYFDCNVKLPRAYAAFEEKIKAYLQKNVLSRGKLDVSISVQGTAASETRIDLDAEYPADNQHREDDTHNTKRICPTLFWTYGVS